MADEQKIAAVEGEKPMTDQELEAMLRKSENVTEFPEVTLDEFTEPSWDECGELNRTTGLALFFRTIFKKHKNDV